jgi:GxxExxY protein
MYLHDPLTERIIGCAIAVHKAVGPGLIEATYEEALGIELSEERLRFARQLRVPVTYRSKLIGEYRPDLVVEEIVVVEIKSVERLIGLHQAQLLAYMRVLRLPVGLLLNFNGERLRSGVRRLAIEASVPSLPRCVEICNLFTGDPLRRHGRAIDCGSAQVDG